MGETSRKNTGILNILNQYISYFPRIEYIKTTSKSVIVSDLQVIYFLGHYKSFCLGTSNIQYDCHFC